MWATSNARVVYHLFPQIFPAKMKSVLRSFLSPLFQRLNKKKMALRIKRGTRRSIIYLTSNHYACELIYEFIALHSFIQLFDTNRPVFFSSSVATISYSSFQRCLISRSSIGLSSDRPFPTINTASALSVFLLQ